MKVKMKSDEAICEGVLEFGLRTRVANRDDRSRETFCLIGKSLLICGSKLNDLDRESIRDGGKYGIKPGHVTWDL